jgi:glycine cleavage system H protein
MNIPENLFYTKEHEWVKIEGRSAKMGITDYAQSSLGDITFAELPKVGDNAEQFKRIATVESVKAASDIYAPLSGKVTAINEKLSSAPELINRSPYDKGWFLGIEVKDIKEKDKLLTPQAYKEYIEGLQK